MKLVDFEIKSTRELTTEMLKPLVKLRVEFVEAECLCLSNDPYPRKIGDILALPWRQGLARIFGLDHP